MQSSTEERRKLLDDWSYLASRANFPPRDLVLEAVVRLSAHIPGNLIEFGVSTGDSTRALQNTLEKLKADGSADRRKTIFACDSFKGLPEKYETLGVGHFACDPPVIPGVEIVEGYFQDSLTEELARKVGSVSFASLDADLYSSTMCALRWLTPLLHTGSLLLFDEFLGENESEKRAFEDWSEETGVSTILVAEFLREPSGGGNKIDKRPLFQVVGSEEVPRPAPKIVTPRGMNPLLRPVRAVARRIKRALLK